VQSTFAIDLSVDWTNGTVTATTNLMPSNFNFTRQPALWYDSFSGNASLWGGWAYTGSTGYWSFRHDTTNKDVVTWAKGPLPEVKGSTILPPIFATIVQSPTKLYYYGGKADFTEPNGNLNQFRGLVTYDFSSHSWINSSQPSAWESSGISGRSLLGEGYYVPTFGASGVLLFLGGFQNEDGPDLAVVDMESVVIYDIGSGNWYQQKVSGDSPGGRAAFCLTGASADDNCSFKV